MQLNEILENSTVGEISSKTQISENNIKALLENDFVKIKRVKTMGFITIIEREYKVDLSEFKKEAIEFYLNNNNDDESISFHYDIPEDKKEKSGLFKFIVILMIIYAVWYAFNNIDREKLNNVLPYAEEKFNAMINSGKELTSKVSTQVSSLDIDKLTIKDNLDIKEDITEKSVEIIEEPKEDEPISTEVEEVNEVENHIEVKMKKDIYNNKVFNLSSVTDENNTNSENNKTY